MLRKITYTLTVLSLFLPLAVLSETIPAFPMAFWGSITINGIDAPAGTIVEAYYGSELAGKVLVKEQGIYGYSESTKQKLLIKEGNGVITFKVKGMPNLSEENYPSFQSGETINKNLVFVTIDQDDDEAPQTNGSSSNSGSSGGGGGGNAGSSGSSGIVQGAQDTGDKTDSNKSDVYDKIYAETNFEIAAIKQNVNQPSQKTEPTPIFGAEPAVKNINDTGTQPQFSKVEIPDKPNALLLAALSVTAIINPIAASTLALIALIFAFVIIRYKPHLNINIFSKRKNQKT